MPDYKELISQALQNGFSHAGVIDAATIRLMPEVREMCAANKCKAYNASWCCPPAIGDLSECEKTIRKYSRGILVQTTGKLEDELDFETMMETEGEHKEHFEKMREQLLPQFPGMLACGSGTCRRCEKCTYPDAPCRFPEGRFASMEAYGMLVTQVCQDNGIPYYYGPLTITYTSCFLLE